MASWDRLSAKQRDKQQASALRRQVSDVVGPFSPWWRSRFKELGRPAAEAGTASGLARLPAVGERDVCPDGDPAGAAALVVQAGEIGYALHAEGPKLRKALLRRAVAPRSYRALVEADMRATSYVWAGLGLRYPLASTRSDLDVVARAGARLFSVLGITRADVLVSALPTQHTASTQALQLGALGASCPLLVPGDDAEAVAAALRLVPATALVLPTDRAAPMVEDIDDAGGPLGELRTVVLVGAPAEDDRAAVREALDQVGVPADVVVLGAHVPDGHRLMWGECRESGGSTGLHTYPDLEIVELVDSETGERPESERGSREVVLTQLGLRGSALLRWRTGDLADEVATDACPACRRTVPRVIDTAPAVLVRELALRTGSRRVDLRGVTGALAGRGDLLDWRVVVAKSKRDGAEELVVHVAPPPAVDPAEVAVSVARDVRAAAGLLPTQIVVSAAADLPDAGAALSPRVLIGA